MKNIQVPEFKDIAFCKTCGNSKIKGKRCPECARYKPDFTYKVQKSRKNELRVVEVYHVRKRPSLDKNDIFQFKTFHNLNGQHLNFRMSRENPFEIYVLLRGGEHRIGFKMNVYDLKDLFSLWKWKFGDVFGKRPKIPNKARFRVGRPNSMEKIKRKY